MPGVTTSHRPPRVGRGWQARAGLAWTRTIRLGAYKEARTCLVATDEHRRAGAHRRRDRRVGRRGTHSVAGRQAPVRAGQARLPVAGRRGRALVPGRHHAAGRRRPAQRRADGPDAGRPATAAGSRRGGDGRRGAGDATGWPGRPGARSSRGSPTATCWRRRCSSSAGSPCSGRTTPGPAAGPARSRWRCCSRSPGWPPSPCCCR